jgi:hypothetical protein
MKKMIAGALVGIAIILLGIYVWYYYITTLVEEGNHTLFALSLIQIGIGIYILFKASKPKDQSFQTNEIGMPIVQNSNEGGNILKRNAELMQSWHKTADFRDKMQVLHAAADEEDKQKMFNN